MPLPRFPIVVALTGVLTSACSDATAPVPAVAVRATIDRTQFRVGDEVTFATEVRNEGNAAARVPGFPTVFLEVRDAENRVVFFGRSGTFAAVAYPPRILEPGEQLTDSPIWATRVIGPSASAAPAGEYRVRAAVLLLTENAFVRKALGSGYVFSEPIPIRIVAP